MIRPRLGEPAREPEFDHPSTAQPIGRLARALIMALLFVLYAFGQPWHGRGHVSDVEAASIPAWHFVETGSWDLTPYRDANRWFVETDRGFRSNRTPGTIAIAVFGYAATTPLTDGFEEWPSTLIAVVTSWLAALLVAASAERLKRGTWLFAIVVFGLGTATWGVSADQLWPHGPAQLAIAIAVWFLVVGKNVPAGLAMAVAVLIRPPAAIIGLGLGAVKARSDRSWRPLVTIAAPSVAAAVLYLVHSRITFGSWSPTAAYDAVGGLGGNASLMAWVGNVASAFVGPRNGVLVWSAWIAVSLLAWWSIRENVPKWLLATPLLGALYITAHASLEIASGALPYNYRYQLEAVTVAAPLLIMTLPGFEANSRIQLLMGSAIAWSVFLQACFVLVSRCWLDASGREVCALFG